MVPLFPPPGEEFLFLSFIMLDYKCVLRLVMNYSCLLLICCYWNIACFVTSFVIPNNVPHHQRRQPHCNTDTTITTTTVYALQPQSNPYANPEAVSQSGTKYQTVFDGLTTLYPPHTLDERNAVSRTDGYWPYVQKGIEPPSELTYGEFDFYFFAQLLDRAMSLSDDQRKTRTVASSSTGTAPNHSKVFCDIGSGTGRLVIAAATLHPQILHLCRGIELLPNLHTVAIKNLQQCGQQQQQQQSGINTSHPPLSTHALPIPNNDDAIALPMAPIQFDCGSFDDPYTYFGDSDIVFVFSSCMGNDLVQTKLVRALGRQCQPGTIIITTDYMLPLEGYIPPHESNDDRIPYGDYRLQLLETIDGWCWLTGGASTAYVHLVEISLGPRGKIEPLQLSLEDQALAVIHALESGELSDPKAFARNVRNNMVFNGFPECFLPKLSSESVGPTDA